jgi:transcriptional regulator with XRE-family HTH domain
MEFVKRMPLAGNKLNFSDWLQAELDKRQWSQADLARSAGLSRAVINKLLNGKIYPQPATLEAMARALKLPVETTYRAAGLLPEIPEPEAFVAEIAHMLRLIKNPQRKATAVRLLKALIDEEENEQHTNPGRLS